MMLFIIAGCDWYPPAEVNLPISCNPINPSQPQFVQIYPLHNRQYFVPGKWVINGNDYPVNFNPEVALVAGLAQEFNLNPSDLELFGEPEFNPNGFIANWTIYAPDVFPQDLPYTLVSYVDTDLNGTAERIQCIVKRQIITTTDLDTSFLQVVTDYRSVDRISLFEIDSTNAANGLQYLIDECIKGFRIQADVPLDSTQVSDLEDLDWIVEQYQG